VPAAPETSASDDAAVLGALGTVGLVDLGKHRVRYRKLAERVSEHEAALRETEANLRLVRNRYRAIIDTQHDWVARWAADGTLTFVNEAICRFYGLSRKELIGKNALDFTHPDDVQRVKDELGVGATATLRRPAGTDPPEFHLLGRTTDKDGNPHWIDWRVRGILHGDRIVEYQSIGRDVTSQQRVQDERLAAKRRLVNVARQLTDPIDHEAFALSACRELQAILDFNSCAVRYIDAAGAWRFAAGLGPLFGGWPEAIPKGGLGEQAIAERRIVWTPDMLSKGMSVYNDEKRALIRASGVRASAFVPLFAYGQTVGTVTVVWTEPRALTEAEIATLEGFGVTLALGLYAALQHRVNGERARIGHAVIGALEAVAADEPPAVLYQRLSDAAMSVATCEGACCLTVSGNTLTIQSASGLYAKVVAVGNQANCTDSIMEQAARSGAPVAVNYDEADTPFRDLMLGLGIHSGWAAPIIERGQAVAVLLLASSRPAVVTDQWVELGLTRLITVMRVALRQIVAERVIPKLLHFN
jgi:PAS domain S-box-containing protein